MNCRTSLDRERHKCAALRTSGSPVTRHRSRWTRTTRPSYGDGRSTPTSIVDGYDGRRSALPARRTIRTSVRLIAERARHSRAGIAGVSALAQPLPRSVAVALTNPRAAGARLAIGRTKGRKPVLRGRARLLGRLAHRFRVLRLYNGLYNARGTPTENEIFSIG